MKQIFLLAFCLATAMLHAQLTDMHWDTHGVGFKVGKAMKITTNNAEEFTAENDEFLLSIIPIQDANLTADDMRDATMEMAKGVGYDNIHGGEKVEIDHFLGYYVIGTKDGVDAILMSLLDQESATNLLVVLVYDPKLESQAVNIANSFYAYD
jgi:Dihydro-orotase-like